MHSPWPRISVVTPSFNQAAFIEQTVRSVIEQEYPNVEYMVIDGGSTDGSAEVIRKYESRLAYWVSEPDRGQSHAINKGWQRATGDIVAYLNSDDLLEPGALKRVAEEFMRLPQTALIYGDSMFIDAEGRDLMLYPTEPFDLRRMLFWNVIPQPSAFLRRSVLVKNGMLDERFHMSMDYDLWLRTAVRHRVTYVPALLSRSRWHSEAKSASHVEKFGPEWVRAVQKLYRTPGIPAEILRIRYIVFGHIHLFSFWQFLKKKEFGAAAAEGLKAACHFARWPRVLVAEYPAELRRARRLAMQSPYHLSR